MRLTFTTSTASPAAAGPLVLPPPQQPVPVVPMPQPLPRPQPGSRGSRTLADLIAVYQADYLPDLAPATQESLRSYLPHLLRAFGPLPLDHLTPDLLRAWKGRLSERYKPSSVHKYLGRLSALLRIATDDLCWLSTNPMRRVRKPSPGQGRVRFLTADERTRLLAACIESRNPHLYPIVVLALGTGARRNEIRCLRWPEVDFDAGVVRFLRTKTKVDRAVPLVGDARTLLYELAHHRTSAVLWCFPTRDGTRPVPIESPWQTARAKAGLVDFHFHDLRHTFASYMAMSGASLREIAEVLGHRNIQETMKYSHLLASHTAGVVDRMAQRFLTNHPEEQPTGE